MLEELLDPTDVVLHVGQGRLFVLKLLELVIGEGVRVLLQLVDLDSQTVEPYEEVL